jgi:filamentous hemagglutinin family protein
MQIKNKCGRKIFRPYMISLLFLLYPTNLFALPEGGVVSAGNAAINQSNGTVLEIVQSTERAIINWNQFNIATNEQVHFTQPDSSSVTLNRITGGDPSSIFGSLTANGSIFLVNPNGIFFGQTATVDVGSLIATTIDIKNDDFLLGSNAFQETGIGTGFINNQGVIKVNDGGFVFFIAPSGIINQSGIIEAKSLVNEGGTIRLIADTVIESGTLDVSAKDAGADGGEITLFGKETQFTGTLLARGGSERGNGGAVEVSGSERLQFDGFVNASAVNGIAGSLLIDPKDIIIENGGGDSLNPNDTFGANAGGTARIDADKITAVTNNGTGVTLQANNDIIVNEQIVTRTPDVLVDGVPTHINPGGALTLRAGRSILINANITSDNASITLTANDTAAIGSNRDQGSALINMAPATTLNAGGANIVITLSTGSGTGKDGSGAITLDNLTTTHNIKIVNNGPSPSSDILPASASSLITAKSVVFDIGVSGGSVGTVIAPILVAVSNVEARSQLGNVSLASTQDVTVGGAALTVGQGVSGINASGQVNLTVLGSEKKLTNNSSITGSEITLQADQMALLGGTVNAVSGRVTLQPNTAGRAINLGNTNDPSGMLSLSDAELETIKTTGTLQIGNNAVGAILISAPIDTEMITSMALIGGPSGISQTAPITEQNLHIESSGPIFLTDPNNHIGTLSGNVTNSSNNQIIIDDTTAGTLRANASQTLVYEQGPLGTLRLNLLTDQFVILPESPCKGDAQLIAEMTLKSGC